MWLQFTRRTHYQIPFISYPKIRSKVRLVRRIKNREIFLVQIATRPIPKHIYRSLRAFLHSTLTRNEFESFQTQTIHKKRVPNQVSNLSRPKLHKSILLYKNRHFSIRNLTSSIQPKTCIHTCDLLFPFLLSSFLFSSSSSSSSLLSYPFLLSLSSRPK